MGWEGWIPAFFGVEKEKKVFSLVEMFLRWKEETRW
jgi:hypothetical protein